MASTKVRVKGGNVLTPPPSAKWYEILWEKYKDPIIRILIIACIANLVINIIQKEPLWDTLAILAAILITTLVGWWQDMSSKAQFESLNKVSDDEMVKIVTEDGVKEISKADLMVGDEVILSAGDEVPADMLLISATDLCCNESCMTGESVPVNKYDTSVNTDGDNTATIDPHMVCRGTTITEGNGTGKVVAIGDNTKIGQTTRQASEMTDDKTPLTKQLENLADKITVISYWIAGALMIFLNVHYFFFGEPSTEVGVIISKEIGFIMTAVVIVIAAVPEGLALSVVLALTYSVKAMMKDNNLVKKMKATETVGAVDIIFSDKTGTLTQNKMTVVDTDINRKTFFYINSAINSTANLDGDKVIGNPTEGAILKFLRSKSQRYEVIRNNNTVISSKPFNSIDKYMSTVVNIANEEYEFLKGAPEVISRIIGDDSFLENVSLQQARGRRAISFAHLCNGEYFYEGTVFIEDPVRTDVPSAVEKCYEAGIDVVMMTGDNIKTGKQIGIDAGFEDVWAIEAKDFDTCTPPEGCKRDYPNVIARCKPEDKLHIMSTMQEKGYICAMTGDGVNDSPSLNHADVGIAMGSGTSVAKAASDIVLLDDAFPSIVKGVKWGRCLYKNIQSFLVFQLTVNVALCITACLSPLFGCENPFSVIEILYINLVMDALGALALASENAVDAVLKDKPRDKNEFIINKNMIQCIATKGLLLFIAMIILILAGVSHSMLFGTFMMTTWMSMFFARSFEKPISFFSFGRNKMFCGVSLFILIANVLIIQFGGSIFGTTPMDTYEWTDTLLLSFGLSIIGHVLYKVFKLFLGTKDPCNSTGRSRYITYLNVGSNPTTGPTDYFFEVFFDCLGNGINRLFLSFTSL